MCGTHCSSLRRLVCWFSRTCSLLDSPVLHVHTLLEHWELGPHTLLQAAQFWLVPSVISQPSAQSLLQLAKPAAAHNQGAARRAQPQGVGQRWRE